jgi:hypothetical protein
MVMTSLVFQSSLVAPHCNMAARYCCYVCVLLANSSVTSASSRGLVVTHAHSTACAYMRRYPLNKAEHFPTTT